MNDKVKSGIDNGADKAKSATDWAADKVDGVKDSATGLLDVVQQRARNVTGAVGDAASHVRDKGSEWIDDAGGMVSDQYHNAEQTLEHFGRDVTAVIRKHPMAAVAIGLGLGLLLGRVASSRS